MARNGANGKGRVGKRPSGHIGNRRKRNPQTGLWSDRVSSSGLFTGIKSKGDAFRAVRRER